MLSTMKNRRFLFLSFGILLAAGLAVSSTYAGTASLMWIKVRWSPNTAIACIQTDQSCSDTPTGVDCVVNVQTQNGLILVRGYKQGCVTVMKWPGATAGTFVPNPLPYSAIN